MDLETMRARVRHDLHDAEEGSQRWSDDELDRHIARAVQDVSLAAPLEASATLTATGSRELDVSALTSRVAIEAVECPLGVLVPFTVWGEMLTLVIEDPPGDGAEVLVRYSLLHTFDADGTTLPEVLHELVATGAGAYAALEWSSYATNRVNVGGAETWRNYHTWAQERLAAFAKALAKRGRERRLRAHALYRPPVSST